MSNAHLAPFTVAVAQVAPVFLGRSATLEKACELIVDAGQVGARLIVFPAAFIPGYPVWIRSIPPHDKALFNELYAQLLANAVSIPGDTTDRLCRIAQRARVNVVIGMNELDTAGRATCYNTLLYINAQGHIAGKHRSLLLTGTERLVWAQGDESTLQVYQFSSGAISGLIGGEHYLPLLRHTLYTGGMQLYIAAATEQGEPWLSTLQHIAQEGCVFVLACGMLLHRHDLLETPLSRRLTASIEDTWIHAGESAILNPAGEFLAGPVRERETMLYAEINLQACMRRSGCLTCQDTMPVQMFPN